MRPAAARATAAAGRGGARPGAGPGGVPGLAAVFGLDHKTAIRYAENARHLLITATEEQDPARAEGDA